MREGIVLQRVVRQAVRIGCVVTMTVSVALAGPEEDFQAGFKSLQVGDVVGAMAPLRTAALAGHPKAQVLLAEILDRSEFDEEAIELYRKAAEQGDADGMFGLGAMMVAGEGLKQKDVEGGRKWILKAAQMGHAQATNAIAHAYMKAQLGFSQADADSEAALQWVRKAVDNDYLPAIDALIAAYTAGGRWGLQPDKALADQLQAQANRIRNLEPVKPKKKVRRG